MKYHSFSRALVAFAFAGMLAGMPTAYAKETVKLAFIGPLTGGSSAIGLGGAIRLILPSSSVIIIRTLSTITS